MKIKTEFYKLEGCGIYLIPTIEIDFNYSQPTVYIEFWSFALKFHIYHRFSKKFMAVWNVIAYFQLPEKHNEGDC